MLKYLVKNGKQLEKKAGWSAFDENEKTKTKVSKSLYEDFKCYNCGKLIGDKGGPAPDQSILCDECYEKKYGKPRKKK